MVTVVPLEMLATLACSEPGPERTFRPLPAPLTLPEVPLLTGSPLLGLPGLTGITVPELQRTTQVALTPPAVAVTFTTTFSPVAFLLVTEPS